MQKTITFKVGAKKYVSKPFDFEAYCKFNDMNLQYAQDKKAVCIGRVMKPIVEYLFEGTEATQDVLDKLDVAEMVRLCNDAFAIINEINNAGKNA